MQARYHRYLLDFKKPAGTSRGVLHQKETWFIILENEGKTGIGECGILRGLSADDRPDYEEKLRWACQNIHLGLAVLYRELIEFPSIQFGLEMAFQSLAAEHPFELFPSEFTQHQKGISINGLIWMGDKTSMLAQIEEKLQCDFNCIKLKIGAIDFKKELELLAFIRAHYSAEQIEIRVDANGAFLSNDVLDKLNQLAEFKIHSIEQPIAKGQIPEMKKVCAASPIPVALDEELIGVFSASEQKNLLEQIRPQYIILKPSFVGGFKGSAQWIELAQKMNIGWWATSALESNVGLNAIAQWTFLQNNPMPQGLGTGALYTNNFDSPLEVKNGQLFYTESPWNFKL
ncbi:MAG: o-succinylbenzoate synthase [Flavobacteriaceae bacterium]